MCLCSNIGMHVVVRSSFRPFYMSPRNLTQVARSVQQVPLPRDLSYWLSILIFPDRVSHLNLKLTNLARPADQKSQKPSFLCLPSAGITEAGYHAWFCT